MIYNGQEAGNTQRLAFFERDPIAWQDHPNGELYRQLFALKKANTALWNAPWGARMLDVPNSSPETVLIFVRTNDKEKVFAVFNFSAKPVEVSFKESLYPGSYRDFTTGRVEKLEAGTSLHLPAWGYRVFLR